FSYRELFLSSISLEKVCIKTKFAVLFHSKSKPYKIYFMKLEQAASSLLIFCFCFFSVARLQAQDTKTDSLTTIQLRVGVAGNEPFVFPENSSTKGIALDVWEDLALMKSLDYTYTYFTTVEDALYALNRGK